MPPASELIPELDPGTGLWLLGALLLGGLPGWRRARRRAARLQAAGEARRAEQEHEHAFAALSRNALDRNSRAFPDLAHQTLRELHSRGQGDLATKEKAIERMLRPVRETLERIERERREPTARG